MGNKEPEQSHPQCRNYEPEYASMQSICYCNCLDYP